ncbi:phospholipase D-like domain-containing protein [Steroidobacter agaridevorans]|uniref:phospholipase D-like domain-containing protein n=1 Tax=Steroidobacter agaridevorans TaxID=2695856 RepID=UPI00132B0A41|nr:phospholipase D-like domain-containing protein [Steroidobacter agaridevorans]GFE86562.1 cardiolipin synthase B [Steroidobacter agaridevorans]
MSWSRRQIVAAGVIGALLAMAFTVIALNFVQPERRIQRQVEHRYTTGDPRFLHELGTLLGPPILKGNRVANFENGDQIFPAMLEAIRGARHSINFETYIYWSGDIGREFADALIERARAKVPVHVLIDWVGSQKMDEVLVHEMANAGVRIERYHPLHWYHLVRMNNRTHRKLLVVDGKVGFTGGVGIADQWDGNAQDEEHWRDSHYRIEGPAVAQMQAAFMDNWIKATGAVLRGEAYFPSLEATGDAAGQVFTSSPTGGADSMLLMYLLAFSSATKTIDLSASYFVPDELTLRVLIDALKRGVRVRIIVPGEDIDTEIVRKASRASWGELLAAGAQIHEYQPTMFHCKTLIVDGLLVSVGSTNIDTRSFRLNDEANLNVYDADFAQALTEVFEQDLKRTRQITLQAWLHRPLTEKIIENAAAALSSQL